MEKLSKTKMEVRIQIIKARAIKELLLSTIKVKFKTLNNFLMKSKMPFKVKSKI